MYGFVGRSSLLSHDISVLVGHKNCQPCIVGLHHVLDFCHATLGETLVSGGCLSCYVHHSITLELFQKIVIPLGSVA